MFVLTTWLRRPLTIWSFSSVFNANDCNLSGHHVIFCYNSLVPCMRYWSSVGLPPNKKQMALIDSYKYNYGGTEVTSATLYLYCGHNLVNCGHNLLTWGHNLVNWGHNLLNCGHNLVNWGHNLLNGGHNLINCGHNLINCGHNLINCGHN